MGFYEKFFGEPCYVLLPAVVENCGSAD